MVRYPAVAGQFYPGTEEELKLYLSTFCRSDVPKVKAKAVVVPHAGYIYSGRVAGETYSRVEIPGLNVIMGPNHTGLGRPVSVYPGGVWLTPLGEVPVEEEVASLLASRTPFEADTSAHIYEHSLEVQLPFLQFCSRFKEDLSIVPIVFQHISYEDCVAAGEILSEVLSRRDALIVISTDFSHYVSQEEAETYDSMAIEAILNLDPEELYRRVHAYNISMCGVIPATVGIVAAKLLGAKGAELVSYRTSGDVTGDYSQVVGYAGIIIY
ncbi:MAG: AmmeMemoRadiSam system protein B [Desulfurobacteriaceae bacterium]